MNESVDINRLIEILKEKNKVYIQTHNFPDPDAIASAFGLQELLKHFGINSEICYKGRIEKVNILNMIDYLKIPVKIIDDIDYMNDEDYIVIVDAQKGNSNIEDFAGEEVAVIDHHQVSSNPDLYRYCDIRTLGACSTIIYLYYEQLGIEMSPAVATALFYGLRVDTNNLTRMMTVDDVKAFSKLYNKCDFAIIKRLTFSNLTMEDLSLYTRAIDKLIIFDNIAFADLGENCNESLLGAIGDFLLDVSEINFVISYTYNQRGVKFSIRNEMLNIDASKIAANALKGIGNGGGHREMAGGFVPNKNADIILNDRNNIYKRFRNAIDNMI